MKKNQIDDTADIITSLQQVTESWSLFERKQLIRWRIRFFLSLVIAAVVYSLYPQATWIWWLVLGLSAFSLIAFATTRYLVRQKLAEAHQKLNLLKELEQRNHHYDDVVSDSDELSSSVSNSD